MSTSSSHPVPHPAGLTPQRRQELAEASLRCRNAGARWLHQRLAGSTEPQPNPPPLHFNIRI